MITGERLRIAFRNAEIPSAKVADYTGISQTSLYSILKKDSFELEYLKKSAELLEVSADSLIREADSTIPKDGTIQTGDFSQAGLGNRQKVKVDKSRPQQDLAAALEACQRELEVTRALVAAKNETITLLRASFTRPN